MRHTFFISAILLVGVGLRLFLWQNYPFSFDQVQLLQNAENIIQGKLTLIGPRTGPAPLFTGPLIYYWTAFWLKITPSPYTLIIGTVSLHFITGFIWYKLLKRYYSPVLATFCLLLWSCSVYLIALDRIPWNPNLTFLAASCVFVPISSFLKKKPIQLIDTLIIGGGIFLGYQAHFSGLFLFPLAILGLCFIPKMKRKYIGICIVFFLLSLLPAFLFDMRHQWLHVQGIKALLSGSSSTGASYFHQVAHDVLVSLENGGKFIVYSQSFYVKCLIGLFLLIVYVFLRQQSKKQQIWLVIWLIGTPLLYAFYTGSKPEYYYAIQFPAWILLIVVVIKSQSKVIQSLLMCSIVAVNGYAVSQVVSKPNPLGMQDQVRVARYVNSLQPGKIVYYMPHGTADGLVYLIHLNNHSSETVTIEYPKNPLSQYQFATQYIGVMK